jgi:hypothetical protein
LPFAATYDWRLDPDEFRTYPDFLRIFAQFTDGAHAIAKVFLEFYLQFTGIFERLFESRPASVRAQPAYVTVAFL